MNSSLRSIQNIVIFNFPRAQTPLTPNAQTELNNEDKAFYPKILYWAMQLANEIELIKERTFTFAGTFSSNTLQQIELINE